MEREDQRQGTMSHLQVRRFAMEASLAHNNLPTRNHYQHGSGDKDNRTTKHREWIHVESRKQGRDGSREETGPKQNTKSPWRRLL